MLASPASIRMSSRPWIERTRNRSIQKPSDKPHALISGLSLSTCPSLTCASSPSSEEEAYSLVQDSSPFAITDQSNTMERWAGASRRAWRESWSLCKLEMDGIYPLSPWSTISSNIFDTPVYYLILFIRHGDAEKLVAECTEVAPISADTKH